jgi:hypothetical protein
MPISGNYLAIFIAAVAAWIFGAVYYSLLSKPWLAANDLTPDMLKARSAGQSGLAKAAPFLLCFLAEIVMAWTLYGILLHLNMFTLRGGIISGAFCWFGFVLTTMGVTNAFPGRKPMLTIIDAGHWLGVLVIIGAIVGGMGL